MMAISVVMAVFNGSRYLEAQIQSVLSELIPGDQLVVVDDASTDDSLTVLERFQNPAIQILRNLQNQGVIASFERGLGCALHEIIFLCDQDDVWLPGKRNVVVKAFLANPTISVIVSDAEVIDANGLVTAPSFMSTREGFKISVWANLWRNRYLGCAMAFRRSLLVKALPIPRSVPMHDMWIGALGQLYGGVRYIGIPLLRYRRHTTNVSPSSRQSVLQMVYWRARLIWNLCARLLSIRLGWHVRP